MEKSLTLNGLWLRFWSFITGLGMAVASYLTIDHFFKANFPQTIFTGSFCDLNSFLIAIARLILLLPIFRGFPWVTGAWSWACWSCSVPFCLLPGWKK